MIYTVTIILLAVIIFISVDKTPKCPKCDGNRCERRSSTAKWHFKSVSYIRCPDCLHIFHED